MEVMPNKYIKLFEQIRDIPYRIPLDVGKEDASCNGKARQLKKLLENEGLEVRYRVCEFKWSDIEKIPADVASVPHEDNSTHVYLEALFDGTWVKIDSTWDKKLESHFGIADWDGRHDTRIAVKPLAIYDTEKSSQIMDDESKDIIEKDLAINGKFYQTFNEWLEEVRHSHGVKSSMNIIDAFKNGFLENIQKKPEHITTAISNVFIFDDRAYKIYRSDSDFFNKNFNNLSDKKNRFLFTQNDFDWNHRLSPEIYRELKGAAVEHNVVILSEPDEHSEELVIVMERFDPADTLLQKGTRNKITASDCYAIGFQLGEREKHVQKEFSGVDLYDDFIQRYADLVNWIDSQLPREKTQVYLDYLKDFIESHKEEFQGMHSSVGACLDIHADNALYRDKIFLPIDTYAPKESWLHGYKQLNIYRIATDLYLYTCKEAFEEALRGYENSTKTSLNRRYDTFLLLYCSLISWPYQYMLGSNDSFRSAVAEKYERFVESLM